MFVTFNRELSDAFRANNPFLQLLLVSAAVFALFTGAARSSLGGEPSLVRSPVTISNMTCEYLVDPLGIDVRSPRLSWVESSNQKGYAQSAYRIIVASSPSLLSGQKGDMWDTGKVSSSRTTLITYAGHTLSSRTACWWAVQVWDSSGKTSAWSTPATFTMGLLNKQDWKGSWIGKSMQGSHADLSLFSGAKWIWYPGDGQANISAPLGARYFRYTFNLPAGRSLKRAAFVGTADDNFTLAINQQYVGGGTAWYNVTSFDVTKLLHGGTNEIALEANNMGENGPNPAGVVAGLELVFRDGTHTIIQTGPAWKTSLTAPPRWEFAGFDDSSWQFAKDLGAYGMQPWGNLSQGDPSVITSIPHPPLPARYLRHQFVANRQVSKATAYVCGLGFFELYVNGQPTTDHIMDPALSDYAKVNYYVTIDVTKFIKQGQNVLGVALGNGRFYYPRPVYNNTDTYNYGTPRLLMQVEITYADGSHQTIATDRSWKITDSGPIRLNNEYDGEVYDARMVMPGWTLPNYQLGSTKWEPADIMSAPGGDIRAQMMEPMRITKVVHPVKVTNPKPGTYIVDMGQTFYGTVRLHAAGKPGATVKMTSAYTLLPDGTLKTADNRTALTTDIYTFAGKGTETWNPIFKGSGYRRVQVTGFPGTPTVKNFDGLDEYTDVKPVGSFSCSNDLVNKIHNAMRTGMTMFLRSAPLDPDRDERQAWMGDPAKDSESEAYNFNVAAFYTKWMDDVKRAQRTDGSIPEVAMYWTFESGVEWPSVFTIIPDWYTGFYADNTLEANNYDAMKRWVVAMQRLHTLPDGTLEGAGYADWCDTYTIGGKISEYGMTPHEVVTTAYHYNNVRILQRAAKRLGRTQDEQMFKAMGDALYTAFMHKFYNPTTCSYTSGTQCSYVLPLAFGLLPADESQRKRIVDNLVNDIMVVHNGHLTVGLIGNQWLLQVLSEYGRSDVAWKLVTQTTRPSWGYMVGLGSDTIWERWDYDTRDPGMNSQALLIQAGNVDAWFYQTMGGINYDSKAPGFAHTIIHPYFPAGVSWVNCRFNSPHGLIVSNWTRKGSQAVMSVSIPANTTATVTTPDGVVREMKSGSWTLKSAVQ